MKLVEFGLKPPRALSNSILSHIYRCFPFKQRLFAASLCFQLLSLLVPLGSYSHHPLAANPQIFALTAAERRRNALEAMSVWAEIAAVVVFTRQLQHVNPLVDALLPFYALLVLVVLAARFRSAKQQKEDVLERIVRQNLTAKRSTASAAANEEQIPAVVRVRLCCIEAGLMIERID